MRFVSLALFAVWIAPAMAQTNASPPATPAPASQTGARADDQTLICVDQDPGTASRLAPKRVCHTRPEWNKLGGVPK